MKITGVKHHEMCLSHHTMLVFYNTFFYSFLSCFSFQENVPLIYIGKRQVLSQNSVEGKKYRPVNPTLEKG